MHKFLSFGAAAAGLAVGFGAFGTHGLKAVLSAEMLAVWQTAVTYQMWHALALILVALLLQNRNDKLLHRAGWLFIAGIALFSGSLYGLALSNLKWLGMITPIGGVCFLAAWSLITFSSLKKH
ncbi:DUF423 domain-containing protein [Methylosoma difficile]